MLKLRVFRILGIPNFGIKSLTMDDIARELGISKKTLYQQVEDSQEKMSFSLKEAQDYAIKNNLNVRSASLDVEIARKKIWEKPD